MEDKIFLEKIRKEFPELTWKKAEKTKGNWDFDVFILDEKYVFRFPKDKDGQKKLVKEIKLLDYLKNQVKITVPDYIFRSKEGFAGYKFIKGEKVTLGELKKISPKAIKRMTEQMAEFLNILHRTPRSRIRKFGIKTKNENYKIDKLHESLRKKVFHKISEKEKKDIKSFFVDLKKIIRKPYKKVLVHGDLTSANMVFKRGKIAGIIDFTDFHIDEPAVDFKGLPGFFEMAYDNYFDHGDKLFLKRAKLYHRMIGLYVLNGSVNNERSPLDYSRAHKLFRKLFYS